jgi:hypothetical protein
LLLRIE